MPRHPNPSPLAGEGGAAAERRGRAGIRTCVACREEAVKADLIRLVRRPDGGVEADPSGRSPGRGAYVHASADCIANARKRKALERALGASIGLEVWSEMLPAPYQEPLT